MINLFAAILLQRFQHFKGMEGSDAHHYTTNADIVNKPTVTKGERVGAGIN